jgi:cytochrome c-type biogenesis protein
MSVADVIGSGPLLLAIPVAAAAGAVTFLSPCCLPLVPGYLSYATGMSGAAAEPGTDGRAATAGGAKGRTVTGTLLFVLGFSVVFAAYGTVLGGLGSLLRSHDGGLTQVLGGFTILLGLLFAGAFDRFTFAGRIIKPSARPRAGLAGAPLLGVLFGVGWSPCLGPTLAAVLTLSASSGTAARGAFLAFVYGLGLGIPFLIVAVAFQRMMGMLGFFRRNARLVSRVGGGMLIALGVLEVTGAWSAALDWLRAHWLAGYNVPLLSRGKGLAPGRRTKRRAKRPGALRLRHWGSWKRWMARSTQSGRRPGAGQWVRAAALAFACIFLD